MGLLVGDFHLVHKNAVCSGDPIAIQLNGISELIVVIGIEGVMPDVHRSAHAVYRESIMED